MISLLLQRGQEMMGVGDVVAARLLFGRAAEAGNAEAMLEMGKTYDPAVLAQASPLLAPDPAEARRWYQQAQTAGNPDAAERLRQLGAQDR
jgi:TPR repeat protein